MYYSSFAGVNSPAEISKHKIESPAMFSYQDAVWETWNINWLEKWT